MSDVCDVKHVGDLDHIINSGNFKNEISFSDNYSQSFSTPILNADEDCASFHSVFTDHPEMQSSFDFQREPLRGNEWSLYRTKEASPDRR